MSSTAPNQSAQNMQPGLGRTAAMLGLSAQLGGREGELQKMLIDERIKSENFRTQYQSLKEETTRLQDEFIQAQNEIRHLLSDKQTLQHQMKLQAADFQKSLLAKSKRLEELQQQTMSPLQQEMLKAQMQQEMDAPVREMRLQLEEEIEKYKAEYLRLQSQADQQREEHARALESQRLRYQAEMSCLQTDKEALAARLRSSDQRSNDKKLEAVMKERVQLKVRIQGLEAEVAELLAQKESLSQQAEKTQSIQNRRLTESQATLKSLEAERESVRLQLEKMQKELQLSNEESCQLTKRLHGAERQVTSLTCQVESLKFSHKQEVNNIKLEFTLSQGELEKERNKLQALIEGFQTEVELLRAEITQLKAALVEKEREMCRKVQSVRDEEFRRTVELQEEKLELEHHLSSMQQQASLKEAAAREQMADWEERLSSAKLREESASGELQRLRTELQQQRSQILEHQSHKVQMGEQQQRNNKLEEELRNVSNSQEQLRETNKQLQGTLERVREELRTTQVQAERSQQEAERSQQEAERLLQHSQNQSLEEKRKLQQKYAEAKEKMQRAAAAQKKRKTMTETKERKLQNKVQLLEAKLETLELEVSAAKKTLSFCEQAHKRKLKDLLRRHGEFQRVLFEGGYSEAPGVVTSTSAFVSRAEELLASMPAEQHQDTSELWRRMEDLEHEQQQLKELNASAGPLTAPQQDL